MRLSPLTTSRMAPRRHPRGAAPTGKPIAVDAISVFRIADGKIVEEWTVWDALGLLQQVGAVAPAYRRALQQIGADCRIPRAGCRGSLAVCGLSATARPRPPLRRRAAPAIA
jgi:SnoaL-like polyketide cyclase